MEILEVIGYIIDGIILYIFNRNLYIKVKNNIKMPMLLSCYFTMEVMTYLVNNSTNVIVINVIISMIGVFLISLLYDSKWGMRVAGAFLFQALAIAAEMLANGVIVLAGVELKNEEYVVGLFISKIFLFLFSVCIQIIGKKKSEVPKEYLVSYMCIPLMSVFILLGMYNAPVHGDAFMYLLAISIVLINFLSYYLLNLLAKSIVVEKDTERVREQLRLQQEKYNQLIHSFQRGNKIIHDINKHLIYLSKCIDANHFSEAKDYIEEINQSIKNNYYDIRSGNLVIDALMNDLKSRLDGYSCELEMKVDIVAHQITIPDYDLVTILGNMIENIVNSIKDQKNKKTATVEIIQKKDKLIIHTINTYDMASTEKKNRSLFHGTGLLTIEELLEQYGGVIEINNDNYKYDVSVIIPLEK